jgi:uncharacterized membrane protein
MAGMLIGLGGAAVGAAWMYLFDPERGRRRRNQVRDRFSSTANRSRKELGRAARDLNNRVHGITSSAGNAFRSEVVDDELLANRIRSRIGRPVSHPGAVDVRVRDGCATLRGKIPKSEIPGLLAAVRRTPGLREVENLLDIADEPGGGASSNGAHQGGAWKPGNRLMGGLVGAGLAAYGFSRGGAFGTVAKLAGLGVLARAGLNRSVGSTVGWNGGCDVPIQKTITIHAPVETVYRFWSNCTNFPRFMSHLEEVRDLGGGRSHWVADGPGGLPVGWNARTTSNVENQEIAWESERGSAIEHCGSVGFERKSDDETRVNLQMSYKPPAGLLGHTVASILGVDPKHQIDDDLVRMKSLLENGRTRAHHRTVTRTELESATA